MHGLSLLVIPSDAENTLCLNIGQNMEQDNLDPETALYAAMIRHLVSLYYRTPVLGKLSTMVYKGLYPNRQTKSERGNEGWETKGMGINPTQKKS